jgi:alanyl-tRNA synthetase
VGPDSLRFDFSHGAALTDEQLRRIEDLANSIILGNVPVETEVTTPDEARARGAMSLFGEKYGDRVRMVRISPDSVELCGGTHTGRSGDVGLVKITRQESVGAGIRRLYAVTGTGMLDYARGLESSLDSVGAVVKEGDRDTVASRVERLDAERRRLGKEIEDLRRKVATGGSVDLLAGAKDVDGVKVLGVRLDVGDPKAMMEAADSIRDRLGSGVALVGAEQKGKASLVLIVTKDLTDRFDAVKLIRELAPMVGAKGGGGRPDLARTGGSDASGLEAALAGIHEAVAQVIREHQGG